MSDDGYYYLHTNGDLIWKRFDPGPEGDFVKKVWPVDTQDRENAWKIALEALALGAQTPRIRELAKKRALTEEDCREMLKRTEPTELMRKGLRLFIPLIFYKQEQQFWEETRKKWKEDQDGEKGVSRR